MPVKITKWDMAEHIQTADDIAAYIEAAFEDGDPSVITATLGAVAKSKGMSSIAKEAGVTREALYKALSETGDPRLSTLIGVLKALGLHIHISADAA